VDPVFTTHSDGTISFDPGKGALDPRTHYVIVPMELIEQGVDRHNAVVRATGKTMHQW
jgi:hypothetical protein